MPGEHYEEFEVPLGDLVKDLPSTETSFLQAVIRLKDGRSYKVSAEAVRYRLEGVDIIHQWSSQTRGEREGDEAPAAWVFHPWVMVDSIEYEELTVIGHSQENRPPRHGAEE